MNIEDKLALMELADHFTVTKQSEGDGVFSSDVYIIEPKEEPDEYPVVAKYIDGEWQYFVEGVYNCGSNYAAINMDQFRALQDLVERLTGVK